MGKQSIFPRHFNSQRGPARRHVRGRNSTRASVGRRVQVSLRSMLRRPTRTSTRRRRPRQRGGQHEPGYDGLKKFVYRYGKKRRLRTQAAPIYLYTNSGGTVTETVGWQGRAQIVQLYDKDDLDNIQAQLPGANNNYIQLRGANMRMDFTNQGTAPMELKIYHLIAKRDMPTGFNSVELWDAGLASQTTSVNASRYLGMTPYKSQQFTQFWRVKKCQTQVIAPGGNHTERIIARVNTIMRQRRFQTTGSISFAGLTYAMLVVVRGPATNDTDLPLLASTCATKYDFIWNKSFDFTYVERKEQGGFLDDNISHIITGNVVREMDGVVSAWAAA